MRLPLLLAALVLAATAGCSSGGGSTSETTAATVSWPAPPDPMRLAVKAGLTPERRETLLHHVHAHLDVFVDGSPVTVPAGIGINTQDPGVKHGTNPVAYGGIELCARPCISPLHTHDETGILHTESATPEPNTLGQFFTEWDVRLTKSCVDDYCRPQTPIAVYVDGEPFDGAPGSILLTDQKEIAIVIGTPPAEIPKEYDFSNA
jgi:hypothetical protein